MTTSEHDLFTVAEVADRLRVSKMTVHRLVNAGDIPALWVGRSVRIPLAGLNRYLSANRSGDGWQP